MAIIYRLVLVVALLFSALQSFPSNRIRTGPLCWASKNEHMVRPPSPRCVLSCPYTCAGAPLPAMLPRPILPPRRCSGVFTTCTSLVLLPIPSFSTAVEETPQLQSSCSTYCCWFDLACLAWLSLSQSVLACLYYFSAEPSTRLTASQLPWPTPHAPPFSSPPCMPCAGHSAALPRSQPPLLFPPCSATVAFSLTSVRELLGPR